MVLPTISGRLINLRRLKRSDAPSVVRHLADPKVMRWLQVPSPYDLEQAFAWIRKTQAASRRENAFHFGIEQPEQGEIIGGISIKYIFRRDRSAEVGYWLGRNFWGQGYTSEALQLLSRFAFREMNLHRLWAVAHGPNIGSQRVLEKNGFRYEGTWRKASLIGRRWYDIHTYGLLREEYRPLRSSSKRQKK